jgi:hypothetical protein
LGACIVSVPRSLSPIEMSLSMDVSAIKGANPNEGVVSRVSFRLAVQLEGSRIMMSPDIMRGPLESFCGPVVLLCGLTLQG